MRSFLPLIPSATGSRTTAWPPCTARWAILLAEQGSRPKVEGRRNTHTVPPGNQNRLTSRACGRVEKAGPGRTSFRRFFVRLPSDGFYSDQRGRNALVLARMSLRDDVLGFRAILMTLWTFLIGATEAENGIPDQR